VGGLPFGARFGLLSFLLPVDRCHATVQGHENLDPGLLDPVGCMGRCLVAQECSEPILGHDQAESDVSAWPQNQFRPCLVFGGSVALTSQGPHRPRFAKPDVTW
jgi:hypothetical protein